MSKLLVWWLWSIGGNEGFGGCSQCSEADGIHGFGKCSKNNRFGSFGQSGEKTNLFIVVHVGEMTCIVDMVSVAKTTDLVAMFNEVMDRFRDSCRCSCCRFEQCSENDGSGGFLVVVNVGK